MATNFDLSSLRGKITGAYLMLAVGTSILGAIAFWDLMFLQRQVTEGEVVSNLKDAVLEMRREEKNLFLYADDETLSRVNGFVDASLDILDRHAGVLGEIMRGYEPSSMTRSLIEYRNELAGWSRAAPDVRQTREEEIRRLGHRIYLSAEALSSRERVALKETVEESQWFLIVSFLVIGVAIYVVGHRLKRVAVTPLRQLESRLMPIAEGRFNQLEPPSNDREFITFTNAFNRMLKELEIRQKRMLQSEKLASLGTLAAGVAHELNNPLSNISSSCQLLMEELEEAGPEQLATWLKQIDSETERGRNIVRTLLYFGGQRVFERTPTRLEDVVDDTRTIMGKALRERDARLTISIPESLTLEVDRQRMQQLFINLVQNALHAGGQGVHVRIDAAPCGRNGVAIPEGAAVAGNTQCIMDCTGQYAAIAVSDDGPGIPPENLSKVFDPFFTSSESGQGVGLGLFIVQEIVREHDGCLAIASLPGHGTQVIILLPGGEADSD